MMPSSLLNVRGLATISPGPLVGSTLVLAVLWVMHQGRERQLSWTGRPLPPRGYHISPTGAHQVLIRVGMTADQPKEGTPGFCAWVLQTTTRFHGRPWLLHIPGRADVLVVSSPQQFEDVQRTFAMQFEKVVGPVEGLGHDVHGGPIAAVCSGSLRPSIHTQRQLAATVLGSSVMRQMATKLVAKHAEVLVNALEDAADSTKQDPTWQVDVTTLTRHFAMEVFAELGFGLQLGALRGSSSGSTSFEKAVDDIQVLVAKRSKRPAVVWKMERLLGIGDEAALSRSIEAVRSTTVAIVEAKMKKRSGDGGCDSPINLTGYVDMVDFLLQQKCSSKSAKDPQFLAEFVLGLVVAARESMAYTLSMCLHCLAQHPEEQEKLFRDLSDAKESTIKSSARLEAVVKETLRLFPIKSFIRRRAKIDVVLSDGTFVAAGTDVAMDVYGMARRDNVWGPGSGDFRPDRWIDSKSGKLRPVSNYKFNAFLGGPQACLGADMAMAEIKTVLAAVVTKLHIAGVSGGDCKDSSSAFSNGAVHVQVSRRGSPGHYS